jgi:hypothetical protein
MGASEARKARRARGLASSPTIGADLGDQNVGVRKVVATQAPLEADSPEDAKLINYEPIQEEQNNRETDASGKVTNPGTVFKVIPQGVESSIRPSHPAHTGLLSIASDARKELKRAANGGMLMDASHRQAYQRSMDGVDAALRAAMLHHGVNDAGNAIASTVQAGTNLKSVIRALGRQTLGASFIHYPVDPEMLVDHHVNSYLGS